ncbi:PREDICTED: sec1 family domain-containing protein MIP3 isoform X3 [Camelina sativa]|uniref:Sec1 family domain-containing protein MIP3 isoform X2 n=1 Tax=Camelina sativa TaxID=90675 RepID=A0ABM0YUL6_CAMSA|nr:PREDICTED: sec1 family domain-containing protein MIP3 isoform X2 [Camelina sativa]XP_019100586.1 PREDICTED: sec1 family domain-containing protein MIP3 isoform X3 [Camelina sativa]
MALVDVAISCLNSIREIEEEVKDAIVYIDAGCTESFQFAGAYPLFLELGARAVCSLENMTSLDAVADWNSKTDCANRIVIMTSRLLNDAHRYMLRCLTTHDAVQHCTVFTSISEGSHSAIPDSPLGPDAYHEYETLLVQDYNEHTKKSDKISKDKGVSNFSSALESLTMEPIISENVDGSSGGEEGLVVSVRHFPLIICPFTPRAFVLPSQGSVAEASLSRQHEDSLSFGLPPISTGSMSDTDDVPPGATLTAHFLYQLALKMELKLEIFSLGDLSKNVGKILTDMSSSLYDVGRRKRSAGLLLVDRTLDLTTPCCHGDSLFDRIFSSLPRADRFSSQAQLKQGVPSINRPSLDVQVPLGELLNEEPSKIRDSGFPVGVEAFLRGWDSYTCDPQNVGLLNEYDKKSTTNWTELLNGSLVATECFRGTPYLEAMIDRKTKDGSVLVKKWLQEALRRENISVNVRARPGYATKPELQAMIRALSQSQSSLLKNKGIIHLAAATAAALDDSQSAKWDTFSSAEMMLNVSAGDTSQGLAAQISDLINKSAVAALQAKKNEKTDTSSRGLLSFRDALLLTIVGYIVAGENFPTSGSGGPFSWQEEHFLKEAIVDAVLENPSVGNLKFLNGLTEELEGRLNRLKSEETKESPADDQLDIDALDDDPWGKWGDEEEEEVDNSKADESYDDMQLKLDLRDRVDSLFRFLHKLSSLRTRNLPLREGLLASESSFSGDPSGNKGLLYRLIEKVLIKQEIPGLEYHSSTVGRFLKSGFGRFGLGQAKPSLADQSVILVFVIGGINGREVLEAQEAVSESGRPDINLVIGGTTLLTPDDMFDLLMGQFSHF